MTEAGRMIYFAESIHFYIFAAAKTEYPARNSGEGVREPDKHFKTR